MAVQHAKSKYYSRRLILPLIIALCTFAIVIFSTYLTNEYKLYISELDNELYNSVIKYLSLFFCSLSLFLIVDANNAKKACGILHDSSFSIITRHLSILALFVSGFCLLDFYLDNIVSLSGIHLSIKCIYTSSFVTTSCIKHLLPKLAMLISSSILLVCIYSCIINILIPQLSKIVIFSEIKLEERKLEKVETFISKLSLGFRYSSVP